VSQVGPTLAMALLVGLTLVKVLPVFYDTYIGAVAQSPGRTRGRFLRSPIFSAVDLSGALMDVKEFVVTHSNYNWICNARGQGLGGQRWNGDEDKERVPAIHAFLNGRKSHPHPKPLPQSAVFVSESLIRGHPGDARLNVRLSRNERICTPFEGFLQPAHQERGKNGHKGERRQSSPGPRMASSQSGDEGIPQSTDLKAKYDERGNRERSREELRQRQRPVGANQHLL